MIINDENAKRWQKFGMDIEKMAEVTISTLEKIKNGGGKDSDTVAISMTGAMTGLAKMRQDAYNDGDVEEFDAMLDNFHRLLEAFRIVP